jgi:uncharacterized protein (UPF0276 family)
MTRIRIGATVTPALFDLLAEDATVVDYIKVDGDLGVETVQRTLTHRPVLLHDLSGEFWLNYADPFTEEALAAGQKLLDLCQPPWFSTGIGASAEPQGHTTPFWRGAAAAALQPYDTVVANIVRNGRRLTAWLGATPLLLENYNYHPTNAYEYICEPETFSLLIDSIGCGVLLDLAHAQISAHNLGWPSAQSYLQALPLDKVREIHINRPAYSAEHGQMLDRHLPIEPADVDLLGWTLAHTPAEAVTLESEAPSVAELRREIALVRQALGSCR